MRYVWLFVGAVALALVVSALAKGPHAAVREAPSARRLAAAPMRVEILAGDVAASKTSIPAGTPIILTVMNASGALARLSLAGYEDRVDTGALDSGDSSTIEFVADRPGDRFTWIVDGTPRGRLDVTGSHLVEGHP
jgi:hypothetical protein